MLKKLWLRQISRWKNIDNNIKEIWATCIVNSNYEVSNLGRCRNTSKQLLKIDYNINKNPQYTLYENGKKRSYSAKYLIYESFNGLVPNGHYVKYKDNNNLNIKLDNLILHSPIHISYDNTLYKYVDAAFSIDRNGFLQYYKFKNSIKIGSDGSIDNVFLKSKYGYDNKQILLDTGKRKAFSVHKLVAAAFLPDYDPYKVVNHIDHNIHNNDISNLECIDQEDNVYHAFNISIPIDTSMTYELRDENDDIYGCYHSFEEASKEMETYLVDGGIMHINVYKNNDAA